jgi:hypothetical protein
MHVAISLQVSRVDFIATMLIRRIVGRTHGAIDAKSNALLPAAGPMS